MSAAAAGRKRRMVAPGRAARPIDKELKVVNQAVTNSVTSTTLKTTTFPGTVVGLRWSCGAQSTSTTDAVVHWAIVVIPDGEAANTPATSDGADFYTPEQNVLAFGVFRVANNAETGGNMTHVWEGTTKTMRKLKQGDVLAFITIGNAATSVNLDGVLQFFFKT